MPGGIKSTARGMKGAVNRALASRVETILAIPGSRLYRKFEKSTKDVERTQTEVLKEILRYAGDSVFGREHNFDSINSYADFKAKVPVREYEQLRPYVERHAKGEEGVLFPGKPLMYNRSSGTTALPKLLPVTPYNFRRTVKDRGKLWLYGLSRNFPGIFSGKDLTLVSPAVEGHTDDGTPFGSLSGLIYQNIPEFMKLVHTIPYGVVTIDDYDSKVYALLRFGVASDVTVILTGNPSTVLNLAARADAWKEDLIRDIRDGTLKKDLDIAPKIRAEAEDLLEPDPARAADLDKMASSADALTPSQYWPNLRLIHTWKNGNCALVVPKLGAWFRPDTPILDFGYIASEITATDLIDPKTDGSILAVRSGFFEFCRFEEQGDPKADFLMAHQLEIGQRYFVYVTTFSGLYRYDMNDVVEAVGRFNQAPIIRFLFKGKGITNIQGEKLSEAQFIEAVTKAVAASGLKQEFFVGYADAELQRYRLYIEIDRELSAEKTAELATTVDESLCRINVEYEAKRKSDRLKPLEAVLLGKDSFNRFRDLRLAEGAHDGQLKWMNLSSEEVTKNRMQRLAGR